MKDILILVRDFQKRTPAVEFGVRLAATFGASVTGVCVFPHPLDIAPASEPELVAAAIEKIHQLVDVAAHSGQSFLDRGASLGATQADWVIAEGPVSEALAQAATRHDLLVLDHATDDRGSLWQIPGVILATRIPCIVLPRREMHYNRFERIAIAWNGSPEAMRAVHAALPLLQDKQALLIRGEERTGHAGVEWNPPFDIYEYLRQRGVMVESCTIGTKPDDVGATLLEKAKRFRADLLVMGAYGRNRFSERMLGGATRDVLTRADLLLFMCH